MNSFSVPDPVHPLLQGLFDYAGLFPPAGLSIPEAVRTYASHQRASQAALMARFIIPVSRIEELLPFAGLFDQHHPLRLSVLGGGGSTLGAIVSHARAESDRVVAEFEGAARVEAIEARCPEALLDASDGDFVEELKRAAQASGHTPLYVELPVAHEPDVSVARIGAYAAIRHGGANGLGTKIRFGGATEADYPTPVEAARFVHACLRMGVPFKATAGLHHPVRHYDAQTGATMHGFLNLMAATALGLVYGWDAARLAAVLADTNPRSFSLSGGGISWGEFHVPASAAGSVRNAVFRGLGSCSLDEPHADLVENMWFEGAPSPQPDPRSARTPK